MARPQKNGLEYFPLDVMMDDEVQIIEAEYGLVGFAILIKMFQKIYSSGYYYEWNEKQQILFGNKVSTDRNLVVSIISDCIRWGIFDSDLYERYRILTSKRIQNHYSSAVYKRVNVQMVKEYLIVEISNKSNIEIIGINDNRNDTCEGISDIGNKETSEVSDIQSTQSKSNSKSNNKDSRQKRVYDVESIHYKLAFRLYQKILDNHPDYTLPNLQSWADDIRKLVELDGKKSENVEKVIDWVQQHDFWYKNILSASKLRKQYDRLVIEIRAEHKKKQHNNKEQKSEDLREKLRKEVEHGQAPGT
jgi:hypothetical protein